MSLGCYDLISLFHTHTKKINKYLSSSEPYPITDSTGKLDWLGSQGCHGHFGARHAGKEQRVVRSFEERW